MVQDALDFAFLNPAREATLTGEAQMGDHDAFLDLARHYQRPLYRILRAAGSAETEAAGLVEETLVRAWRDMPRFPGGRRFFPWLVAVARPFLPERIPSASPDAEVAPRRGEASGAAFHLTSDEILATLLGRGNGIAESAATWDHLVECEECSSRLAALAMQEGTVPIALTTGPEQAVLERIAETVERRIRPVTEAAPDTNQEPALDTRVKDGSPPWGTLIIIGTLLASVGAMHMGMEFVPRWLGGPVGHGDTVVATSSPDSSTAATPAAAASDAAAPSDDAPVAALPPVTVTPAAPVAKAPTPKAPAAKAPTVKPTVAKAPAAAAARPAPPSAPAAPATPPAPAPAALASAPAAAPVTAPAMAAPDAKAPEAAPTPSGTRAAPPPAAAPAPARAPAAALPIGPIALPGTVRASAIGPDGSAVTPAARVDTFASVGRPARGEVSTALRRDEEASLHPSIYAYEVAADAWEQTLPLLHGEDYLEARLHLASARYRAWTLGRDSHRATQAASAIRSYLVGARPGPDRGRATHWLADIIGK